jgi:hypothetical protein
MVNSQSCINADPSMDMAMETTHDYLARTKPTSCIDTQINDAQGSEALTRSQRYIHGPAYLIKRYPFQVSPNHILL